jgi:hypothetical protein
MALWRAAVGRPVDFFRNLTNTGLEFRMITAALDKQQLADE